MGVGLKFSSSSFDTSIYNSSSIGNPNPKVYRIIRTKVERGYLILEILYPDCRNFEGRKILMFDKGVQLIHLMNQGAIDPHFSDNKNFISPIARFEPTRKGWGMAEALAKNIG